MPSYLPFEYWGIQRQALEHKPFAEIGAVDRRGRDRPAIGVEAEGRTISRTPVRQGRLLPASWRAEKRERKRVGAPALSVNPMGPKPVPVPLPSRFYHRSWRPKLYASPAASGRMRALAVLVDPCGDFGSLVFEFRGWRSIQLIVARFALMSKVLSR